MDINDLKEVETAIKEREGELQPLYTRFDNDFKYRWLLEPFQLGSQGEYANYTTNESRNLAKKVIDTLTKAPVKYQVPISDENEKERDEASNDERFGYGVNRLADDQLRAIMQPPIQSQASFYAPIRGWVGVLAFLNKTKDSKRDTYPVVRIWDIRNTTWALGKNGLDWGCHTRYLKASDAKAEFADIEITSDCAVRDFWNDEWHLTYIVHGGKGFFGKMRKLVLGDSKDIITKEKHGIGHIPAMITQVGSSPYIQAMELQDTIKDWGESIFAEDRNIFDVKNELITLLRTIVKLGAHNPIVVKYDSGKGGKPLFTKSPYYAGSIIPVDVSKGQEIDPLFQPEMPKDASGLLNVVQQDIVAGGMSPLLQGQTPFPATGIGTSLLMEASASMIYPSQKCVEGVLEWIVNELKTQYHGGGYNKLKLRGWDSSNKYFDVTPSKDELSDDRYILAMLKPKLPEDEYGKVNTAATVVQNNLLSLQTAMDRYMSVEDTDGELNNMYKEQANMLPVVLKLRLANAVLKDNPDKPELAFAILSDTMGQGGGNGAGAEQGRLQPGGDQAMMPEIEENIRLARMGMRRG